MQERSSSCSSPPQAGSAIISPLAARCSSARSKSIRGASPLGLPYTLSRAPLRRRAPVAWLTRSRSLALPVFPAEPVWVHEIASTINAMTTPPDPTLENLLRELTPSVVGAVVRRFGDFSAAEDAVQEALFAATLQWPKEGLPENPRGWLIDVAARRMTDHIRSESARRRRETTVVMQATVDEQIAPAPDEAPFDLGSSFGRAGSLVQEDGDDTLILLFMCCHASLTRSSAIALTLRAVGGLTTAEIAAAFLVPESTMAQRISRAKQRIKSSGVPFRMPTDVERAERLDAVLHVLYLIFNEGYRAAAARACSARICRTRPYD